MTLRCVKEPFHSVLLVRQLMPKLPLPLVRILICVNKRQVCSTNVSLYSPQTGFSFGATAAAPKPAEDKQATGPSTDSKPAAGGGGFNFGASSDAKASASVVGKS